MLQEMANSKKQVSIDGTTIQEADVAKDMMAKAVKSALKAQQQVDDWLVECSWDSEARQVIDDMARIGTGVLKGPFPEKCIYTMLKDGQTTQVESIEPKSRRISARNLFPDPACGEDIHAGDYIFEVDHLTAKRLRDLKDLPGYLPDQIEAVLEEGPMSPEVEPTTADKRTTSEDVKSKPFQVWYYTGTLTKDDMEAAGCACPPGMSAETIPAIITMVNRTVIRASLNPLDNGKFGYDVAPCSRREGSWAGIGIAAELITPQRMITGAIRQLMTNMGLSSGVQIVLRLGVITPADGIFTITPNKIWYASKDSDIQDVDHAFKIHTIDSRQEELLNIIQFALKMAEDVTGLPALMQGQQGKAPDLVGVVQILNENATSVARRVAKMFDDNLLEPHIGRYYDWLMQNGEDRETKGDYTIDVLTPPDVMADKTAIMEMGKLSQDPDFGVDKKKLFAELCRANRFDPARIQYSDDEWKKIQAARAKQPPDPSVQVAQINAKVKAALQERKQEFDELEALRDRQLEVMLAGLEQSGEKSITLDELKTKLADTAMKLRTQRELSFKSMAMKAATAPSEPAGKAPAGQAFQR